MKNKIRSLPLLPFLCSSLMLTLGLSLGLTGRAHSAELAGGKKMMMKMDGKMMEGCQEMQEHKQKMMAEMKAQDAELTAQVAKMNSAPESKKPALMAAIVTQLVAQRTAANEHMGKMQDEMMAHMMAHMQAGKDSMSECPMMKGMADGDEKSANPHQGHGEDKK